MSPQKNQSPDSVIKYLLFTTEDSRYMKMQDFSISDVSGVTFFKSFNPKMHRERGNRISNNIIECLTCACGKTTWWFSDRMNKCKPEFSNRKCRYNYHKTFSF